MGRSPGSLALLSSRARAIVSGKSDAGNDVAVVASGRLGRGRVLVFADDCYLRYGSFLAGDSGILVKNAILWASVRNENPRVALIDLPELKTFLEREGVRAEQTTLDSDFQGYDVLALVPYDINAEQANRVRSFVESGGGLLAAATGLGWMHVSKKPITEFPGNMLVAGSGIAWTDSSCQDHLAERILGTTRDFAARKRHAGTLERIVAGGDFGPKSSSTPWKAFA